LIAEENADRRFGAPLGASERARERVLGWDFQPQLLVKERKRKRGLDGRGRGSGRG
jgi:hypothetical protein